MEPGHVHLLRHALDALRSCEHLRLQQLPPRAEPDARQQGRFPADPRVLPRARHDDLLRREHLNDRGVAPPRAPRAAPCAAAVLRGAARARVALLLPRAHLLPSRRRRRRPGDGSRAGGGTRGAPAPAGGPAPRRCGRRAQPRVAGGVAGAAHARGLVASSPVSARDETGRPAERGAARGTPGVALHQANSTCLTAASRIARGDAPLGPRPYMRVTRCGRVRLSPRCWQPNPNQPAR
mmetsp:Transcript_4163/g.14928  ORF Transcript_4163/g.14928 Transcript_4163/m.14928 type:complete len:237 (+) Transcript_4163:1580-2290(+)